MPVVPRLSRVLSRVADLVWPPRSLLSEATVSAVGVMEPDLWANLDFLDGLLCVVCGTPLPEALGGDETCLACLATAPAFDSARAAIVYTDLTRGLVLALKRGGRADGLPVFAQWMARALPRVQRADVIVPVPLHWTRLVIRGFNQSAWLAGALARHVGRPWSPGLLVRRKRTPSQAGLSGAGRARNVQGAFAVPRGGRPRLAGAHVVLVDDVFTTGATVEACTRVLRRAGAARVDVVCLARVVRPVRADITPL